MAQGIGEFTELSTRTIAIPPAVGNSLCAAAAAGVSGDEDILIAVLERAAQGRFRLVSQREETGRRL